MTLEVSPDRWAAGGEAIARDPGGRIVFVRGAIPGETVLVEVTDEKKDFARGVAVDVLEPSPDRVVPPCPSRRAGCGGCGWQHLTVDAQRRARRAIVEDALRRTGRLVDPVVTHGGGVDAEGYRTTVRVTAGADGRAGYHAEQSHDVVAAPDCLIAHPTLRALLPTLTLTPGLDLTLRVSVATGALAAHWDPKTGSVDGLPNSTLTGREAVVEEDVAGHRLRASIWSFFQSGPQAAELLVDAVWRAAPELEGAELVVDAYAGVGMFAVAATDPRSRVIAVETVRSSIADATHNLRDREAQIVRGEVGGWHAPKEPIDVVIADPARSGLGKPGARALSRIQAPVLVLVSCDPASLGRDAHLLAEAGYVHETSEVIDTFPHTTHVEVVTRFARA